MKWIFYSLLALISIPSFAARYECAKSEMRLVIQVSQTPTQKLAIVLAVEEGPEQIAHQEYAISRGGIYRQLGGGNYLACAVSIGEDLQILDAIPVD